VLFRKYLARHVKKEPEPIHDLDLKPWFAVLD
jgi:hypothetical protein